MDPVRRRSSTVDPASYGGGGPVHGFFCFFLFFLFDLRRWTKQPPLLMKINGGGCNACLY